MFVTLRIYLVLVFVANLAGMTSFAVKREALLREYPRLDQSFLLILRTVRRLEKIA